MSPQLHFFAATIARAAMATPLWITNHTSQVMSMKTLDALLITGSQFDSDQSVSSLDVKTGKVLWSSTTLEEWTYGVAVQPGSSDDSSIGVAAFGCAFDPEQEPVMPCELGFWKNASDVLSLVWKMPIAGAELSASHGPPFVSFTPDGKNIIVTFIDRNSTTNPGAEFMAVVPVKDATSSAPLRAMLGYGLGHGLHVDASTADAGSVTHALLSRPPPAPTPPPPTTPWLPATDCNPACPPGSSCCKYPSAGQGAGVCMGEPDRPISNCSQIPHAKLADDIVTTKTAASSRMALHSAVGSSMALHFAVTLDASLGTIDIAEAPAIDCNETALCSWLTASADLSIVLVNAAATVSSGAACEPQPDDPQRWGIALLVSDQGWPPKYSIRWTQCSTVKNSKQLKSVHLSMQYQRVIATFAHITPGTSNVKSLEVCAFDTDDGAQLWCTPEYATPSGGTLLAIAATISEDGWLVFFEPFVGILCVDTTVSSAPSIDLLFSGAGLTHNCCAATAITATRGVMVASIPMGTQEPPFCNCVHSQLIGVSLPPRA